MLLTASAEFYRTAAQTIRSPCCTSRPAAPALVSRKPRRQALAAAGRAAVKAEKEDEFDAQVENSFMIEYPENTRPNLDDDDWYNKVTDWHEFWNHQVWDPAVDALDDEHDAYVQTESSVARAHKLLEFVKDFHKREDFVSTFPIVRERDTYYDAYESPPDFWMPDPQPKLNINDLRAISDKRRRRALFDAEWERRKALVGHVPLTRTDQERDVRYARDGDDWDDVKHDWSEQDIWDLITNSGANADPSTHGVHINNPLVPVDFTTDYGIDYIEETEEFISRIGHMLEDDEVVPITREVELTESDLTDFDELMEHVPGHNLLQMSSMVQNWALAAEQQLEDSSSGGGRRRAKSASTAEQGDLEGEEEEQQQQGAGQTVDLDEDLLADDTEDISNIRGAYGGAELPEEYQL